MRPVNDIAIMNAQNASDSDAAERLKNMQKDKREKMTENDADAVREQAVKFEAMLVKKLFDEARKTVDKSNLFGDSDSPSKTIYQSMLDAEYANIMAESHSFGFAEMIMQEFGVMENALAPSKEGEAKELETLIFSSPLGNSIDPLEGRFIEPATGRISSRYGARLDPFTGKPALHKGLDIAMPMGRRVHAADEGVVTFAGEKRGYGKVVIVDHGNGVETRYAHLNEMEVKAGDSVNKGEVIALSGNTGRATGPHLHFEIRIGGKAVNPEKYIQFRD